MIETCVLVNYYCKINKIVDRKKKTEMLEKAALDPIYRKQLKKVFGFCGC